MAPAEPPAADAVPSASWQRVAITVGACVATIAVLLLAASRWGPKIAEQPPWEAPLDAVLDDLARWQRIPPIGATSRVVWFSDSLSRCGDGVDVGATLWPAVRRSSRDVEAVNVFGYAMRPLPFYYLGAAVTAAKPDLALIEVNPTAAWPTNPPALEMRYRPLSRRLSVSRWWPVRQALVADGVSWLDPWIYWSEERLGLLYVVDGIQTSWRAVLAAATTAVNRRLGLPTSTTRSFFALSVRRARIPSFDGPIDAYPGTVALRALYHELRTAGIPVLFYVPPRPADDRRDPPVQLDSFDRLREAIGASVDEWTDLSSLVAADRFRDARGHLYADGCAAEGRALAEPIAQRLDARSGR